MKEIYFFPPFELDICIFSKKRIRYLYVYLLEKNICYVTRI